MEPKLIYMLCSLLILINAIIYIKCVLIDHNDYLQIFIKCIPPMLLSLQTCLFLIVYKYANNKKKMFYCGCLLIGFMLCMFGDICLVFKNQKLYMAGMLLFIM